MLTPEQAAGKSQINGALGGLSLLALDAYNIEHAAVEHHGDYGVGMYLSRCKGCTVELHVIGGVAVYLQFGAGGGKGVSKEH